MDDDSDSPKTLLRSILDFFTQKKSQQPAELASLRSRQREGWLRAESYLQRDNLAEAGPESVARTLRAFERAVPDDLDGETEFVGIF